MFCTFHSEGILEVVRLRLNNFVAGSHKLFAQHLGKWLKPPHPGAFIGSREDSALKTSLDVMSSCEMWDLGVDRSSIDGRER